MVSQNHFSITFDAERRVVLRDASTNRTAVSYNGQARNELRRHFTWIIFTSVETIEVSIPRAGLLFQIRSGVHKDREEEYFANVDKMLPPNIRVGEGGLSMPMLHLDCMSNNLNVKGL